MNGGEFHVDWIDADTVRLTPMSSTLPSPQSDPADMESGTASASYDPPLDEGIRYAVEVLNAAGVETFESCEGGQGHAYPEPTVRFHGNQAEGLRALSAAMAADLPVSDLRRVWLILDQEPTGPWWELVFTPGASVS